MALELAVVRNFPIEVLGDQRHQSLDMLVGAHLVVKVAVRWLALAFRCSVHFGVAGAEP